METFSNSSFLQMALELLRNNVNPVAERTWGMLHHLQALRE
jgi:hypothetical protein